MHYVRSCTTDGIDGSVLPPNEAVSAAALGGWGTILSCIPGGLAYYYDECGARRMLLDRAPSPVVTFLQILVWG
jgi:hypothetical protein